MPTSVSTAEKALQINLDLKRFGTFAEIGAGQEVARQFFQAGRASGTVAKSISAYDMAISDSLYGPTDHYVSRARLEAMLAVEFEQLQKSFPRDAGEGGRALFVFADTVATRSRSAHRAGQGWMGIQFQSDPGGTPSEIIIHVRMFDVEPANEREAVGIAGVNLTYGAFYLAADARSLTKSLMDGLNRRRLEVDMIKFAGPAFQDVDDRLMSLELVESELTDAVMFTADGESVQPSEVLYEKPVLIERGSFRPVTNVTLAMLKRAEEKLQQDHPGNWEPPVILMEMTLKNLMGGETIDHADYLARADVLGALGNTVMISNYTRFDQVTGYLRNSTHKWIAMVVGVPTLNEIFQDKYYGELEGGLLEGLGRLFRGEVRLLIYPTRVAGVEGLVTADNLKVQAEYRSLYSYFVENHRIEPILDADVEQLQFSPGDVLRKLQSGDAGWKDLVPAPVARLIEDRGLFGIRAG